MKTLGLLFKKNLDETLERSRTFWKRKTKESIMAVLGVADLGKPYLAYEGAPLDIKKRLENIEYNLSRKIEVEDDGMPIAQTNSGGGIYCGFFGAEVYFSDWGTSWAEPIIDDWNKLGEIRFDIDNRWIRFVKEMDQYYAEHSKGKFGVSPIETIESLNFAFGLRGATQVYLDVYDHPEKLHKLLQASVNFNIKLIEMQRDVIGIFNDGVFDLWGIWLPGRPVWLSVDTYSICSPDVFVKFGIPYQQQLIDYFGSGWVHMHTQGLYLLPYISKLKNLIGIQFIDDPNEPRAFDKLREIKAVTGDMPLLVYCGAEEFITGLQKATLPAPVMYVVTGIQSVAKAHEIMNAVKKYKWRRD